MGPFIPRLKSRILPTNFYGIAFSVAIFIGMFGSLSAWGDDSSFLSNGVTAHRGFSGLYPENTLWAFEEGIAVNADWLECDIYKTLDGKIVVTHDATTGRVADQDLVVADSTWAELQELDVAYQFRIANGLTLEECPKTTMPLLEDVLQLMMNQSSTRLSIQPKQSIVDDAMAIINSMGAEDWVGFNEGTLSRVTRVKELNPEIPVFYDTNGIDTTTHISQALQYGFETIVMYYPNITVEDIDQIHAAGLQAGAWTVDGSSDMVRLLDMGIDRIYTDYPNTLQTIMKSMPPAGIGQPIAHWSFDADYSSSVNNDSYQGTPHGDAYTSIDTTGAAVRGSGALKLDSGPSSGNGTFVGTESGVGVLYPELHKQIAVSAWFKVEDLSGDGSDTRRFVYETAPTYTLSLEVRKNALGEDYCQWYTLTDAGGSVTTDSHSNFGPRVEEGQWCHVVTNYDLESNRMQFYFNGELLYDQPLEGDSFLATDAFNIGNHRDGDGTRDFDGYIDDVAVYHGVLSPEAIAGLYAGTYSATEVPIADGLADFTRTATFASSRGSQVATTDFAMPAGLSYSSVDNSLVVASRHATEGFIAKIAQDGTQTLLVSSTDAISVAATAVNPANGDLFFISDYAGVLKRVAAGTTTVETWASGFHNDTNDDDGCSMVIVPDSYTGGLVEPGSLLMVDRGAAGFEEIWSISTSASETYSALVSDSSMTDGVGNLLVDPNAIAVTDTQIFVSDFEARKIYEVTAADTLTTFFETDFEAPIFSMIADPSTGDLITINGVGEIHRIDTATGMEELILTLEEKCQTGTRMFNQLAISDDGNQLVVASSDMDTLYLFSLETSKIPGDANNDGRVDGSDVTILAGNWQAGVGDPNTSQITWEMGDFNGDGQIDGSDVTILAGNWQYGVDATTASVPEPTSLVILISLALTLAWLKRI